jgi:hypothetical protein
MGLAAHTNGISGSHNRTGSAPCGWPSFGISGNDELMPSFGISGNDELMPSFGISGNDELMQLQF